MTTQKIRLNFPDLLQAKEVTWEEIKTAVETANPELAEVIKRLQLNKKHTFILARYPYGVNIRKKGVAYFPTEDHRLADINDPKISRFLKESLSYSSSPLGFILNKSVEVYVETTGGRTIPFKLFSPGVTFGVWEIMETPQITLRQSWDWSISSGARTVFMPASINEAASYSRIQRKYRIKSYLPSNIFEQQKIFAEIAHHSEEKWCTEILYFTEQWVKDAKENPSWAPLYNYWHQQSWKQLIHWSNKMILDFNWGAFISTLSIRKIKPKLYLLDTVKHLISIACGTIPGFRPVDDTENTMPSKLIQDAYMRDYGLKTYTPLLMQPDFLLPNQKFNAVYYSLQYPTLLEKPSEFQNFPSVMAMIRELKQLIETFVDIMSEWPVTNPSKDKMDFLDKIAFDFFHNEADQHKEIQQTKKMSQTDSNLNLYPEKYHKKFPEGAHFFRGCIKVSII